MEYAKMRRHILAALAAAGIGLGGTFGASAVPISGSIPGATAPAPELQKAYYYRRVYRRGYYGDYGGYYDYRGYRYYYGGYPSYSYGYPGNFYRRYWTPTTVVIGGSLSAWATTHARPCGTGLRRDSDTYSKTRSKACPPTSPIFVPPYSTCV